MSYPFFSVVIPTRNRPDLLISAVQSVLNQSYSNYEIIISDNSDEPAKTQRTLDIIPGWKSDDRLRYVKPESYMNMSDHWEFATRHAKGEYVAILTDRHVMRPSALMLIKSTIENFDTNDQPELISWNVRSGYSADTRYQSTALFSGKKSLISSAKILSDYVEFSAWNSDSMFVNWLPRGLNSIYRRNLADKIRLVHGRVFFPMTPDYTSAFLFLIYSPMILCLDLPFYMSHGNRSNGQHCATFGSASFTNEHSRDPFDGCVIRVDAIINILVSEYLFVKKLVGDTNLPTINIVGYFLSIYREFLLKEEFGTPLNLQEMYSIWHQEVANLTNEQQKAINEGVVILDKMHPRFIWLRKSLVKYDCLHYFENAMNFCRRIKRFVKRETVYANVLEAARGTDFLLTQHLESCQK